VDGSSVDSLGVDSAADDDADVDAAVDPVDTFALSSLDESVLLHAAMPSAQTASNHVPLIRIGPPSLPPVR